jgi:trimethylamine--corrinoid protein Co-methyltransferase
MARRSSKRHAGGRAKGALHQLPWRRVRNRFPPVDILSADQVEHIHQSSLRVLEELGMEVMGETARRMLKEAGADVDDATMRVRFDRDMVLEQIAKSPSEFTLHSRNPERDVVFGGNHVAHHGRRGERGGHACGARGSDGGRGLARSV